MEARGLAAQELNVIGDVIVEGEIAHGNVVQASGALRRPVAGAQVATDCLQFFLGEFAAPMLFQGEFQFALSANARVAQGVRVDHDRFLLSDAP